MARTISELSPGTIIWCNTTLSGTDAATPFIVLGASQQGNSTLIMQQLWYETKRMESQNIVDTYSGSEMDTYLTSTDSTGYRMKYLSEAFRNCLISTTVEAYAISSDSVLTLSRDIFLASETEVVTSGAAHAEGISYLSALKTATGITDDRNARKVYNITGVLQSWWLRSPGSTSTFKNVEGTGAIVPYNASVSWNSIRPIYSIANGTLVSDDGAETIYLFPDAEKPYRELDIEISMGQCAKQPKMARVVANVEKATESIIKATNNYKDANPVWETVSADGIVTFANETKTTDNWELGVKIYAKSQDKAEVTEPVMTVFYETTDVPDSGGGATDISLGISSATVGQIAKITAVDDNGKPTAWESVNLPSGGDDEWKLIASQDVAEDVVSVELPINNEKELMILVSLVNSEATIGNRALQVAANGDNNKKATSQNANIFANAGTRSAKIHLQHIGEQIVWDVTNNQGGNGVVDSVAENMFNFNSGAFTAPASITTISVSNLNKLSGYYIGAGSKIRVFAIKE